MSIVPARRPVSTYRLQLHADFGFQQARALVPYLAQLGITDCYTSPYFKANPGSRHGYDISDHGVLNPEIGTDEDYVAFADALAAHGLGHIVDFVPNHMAADASSNPWWRDVLQHGERSRFAVFFDIDWNPVKPELRGKVLLPVLGDQYGAVLERGELRVERAGDDGALTLRYFERSLPLDPRTVDPAASPDALNGTPGDPRSFDALHQLLAAQPYRLAYWRTASDEINYRRFFDINELVGLRMEVDDAFTASHALLGRLIRDGQVTGVRVDHPDGLFDPAAYFERLQRLSPAPLYVAAEKILSLGESLSPDWPVAGTTGYDFLNLTSGLFVDPRHVTTLRRAYARLTGQTRSFDDVAYEARQTVMQTTMAAELNVLAHALNRLSEQDRRCRDFTLNSCRHVLREVAACFPVYRTYVSDRGVSAFDRQVVSAAIAEARRRNPVMEGSIFDFLRARLLPTDDAPAAVRRFAMKAQQFTAPVQAKGVEDTAFYRYHALISANEVGGHPAHPAVSAADFHRANGDRRRDWPLSMLATATHDTKRGEDARLRIAAISEIPDQWRKAVAMWMRINNRHRTRVDGPWAPDRNDEYLFYQSLVGAWPAELAGAPIPAAAPPEFVDRMAAYMAKAVREAKVHTSWIHQDAAYEEAVDRFVRRTLTGATAPRFFQAFLPLQRRLAQAGAVNSLAQLVLKLSSPGVPDFYQGTELWDLSLVDPDNRRPVDFDVRAGALASVGDMRDLTELLSAWTDGRVKLAVTARGLRFRRDHPHIVLDGDYEPLDVAGSLSEHVVAFARRSNAGALIAIVPRLTMSLSMHDGWPVGPGCWGDTTAHLPAASTGAIFENVLTGSRVRDAAGGVPLGEVMVVCPVALLWAPTNRPMALGGIRA